MILVSTPIQRLTLAAAFCAAAVSADSQTCAPTEASMIPERAIVLTGDPNMMHSSIMAVLYDNPEFEFHDPSDPRFLFLDRKGKIALGIGGYVYASMSYDFNGEIDNAQFISYDIPVPFDPAKRSGMHFDASHSTIFLQLAGHSDKFGTYSAYVQTNFSGGKGGSHDLKLKQAYVKAGNVTIGLTRSTFIDPGGPPDLDTQGPGAQLSRKNILVRYSKSFGKHWQAAIGAESPTSSTYTVNEGQQQAITQRVPDFPAYVQYEWSKGSHVRLSGLLRTLSYRDLIDKSNRYATGWGVQLSGVYKIPVTNLTLYGQLFYGHGISTYINDLDGNGLDLIPSATRAGKMTAPGDLGFIAGLKWQFCKKAYAATSYGNNRLYGQNHMAADTYKTSSTVEAHVFYTLFSDCQIGLEYLHGTRKNINGQHSQANRLMAAVKYSF